MTDTEAIIATRTRHGKTTTMSVLEPQRLANPKYKLALNIVQDKYTQSYNKIDNIQKYGAKFLVKSHQTFSQKQRDKTQALKPQRGTTNPPIPHQASE